MDARPLRRGMLSRIALEASPASATPEGLQAAMLALRGDGREGANEK